LPHTISGHSNLIKNLDERHHFFCREEKSYQYVSLFQSAKTYYDHDLALKINPEILFANYSHDIKSAPEELISAIEIIFRKSISYSKSNGRVGYLFRDDKESKFNKIDNSFDISNLLVSKWRLNKFSTLISAAFLMAISMFDKIYTDRLHVAIGASILKIPTTLYPNSYYKNKAVFESSLQNLNSCIKFENAKILI
jgi:exopolysaccharide biosynthesis predicted pyruvyltransferase EpsI